MKTNTKIPISLNRTSVVFGVLLLVVFFLPWVSWEAIRVSGYQMPSGAFFSIAEKNFNQGNPFPKYNFVTAVFWLIPIFTSATILFALVGKKNIIPSVIAGGLTLSLITVFKLFTGTLIEMGMHSTLLGSLKVSFYLAAIAAIGIILASVPKRLWILKLLCIVAGPLLTWLGFALAQNYLASDTYANTAKVKSEYTISAMDLLKEFRVNDTLANNKYREKILTVEGPVSAKELVNDSTVNIRMNDSTGSYVIFSFTKEDKDLAKAKEVRDGEKISVKGSCSGGTYSDILETEFITFKRCAFNQ